MKTGALRAERVCCLAMLCSRYSARLYSRRSPRFAALLGALFIASCQPAAREEVSRAIPVAPAESAAVIVEPGAVFAWARDGRAELYRIELFDETGQLLGGAVTRDTTVPADAVVPDTARGGTWRVVPVSGGGTELPASEPRGFRRR